MDHRNPTSARAGGEAAVPTVSPPLGRKAGQNIPGAPLRTDQAQRRDDQGLVEYASWLLLLRKRTA